MKNTINGIMQNCTERIVKDRENQIIEIFGQNGYYFKNRRELELFAKTRCEIAKFPDGKKVLRVDGKIICEWWDLVRLEDQGNGNFRMIAGEPPHNRGNQ